MRSAVLRAEPAQLGHRLAWQLPPSIDNVLAPHGRDLAGTLAGEQQDPERRSNDRPGVVERAPEARHLAIGQDALAVVRLVALDQLARIGGKQILLGGPGEDR